jgi:hypothetical protein
LPEVKLCHTVFNQANELVYIDSGNGEYSGQVVCGIRRSGKTFYKPAGAVYPDIFEDTDKFPTELSCAEASVSAPQSITAKLFAKSSLDSTDKRPLLPLNIGQVGLIGGSGLINGLIECETPHIIKGRIVKEHKTDETDNLNSRGDLISTELRVVASNRMIFNLLTPQGFKSLT